MQMLQETRKDILFIFEEAGLQEWNRRRVPVAVDPTRQEWLLQRILLASASASIMAGYNWQFASVAEESSLNSGRQRYGENILEDMIICCCIGTYQIELRLMRLRKLGGRA
ncbi:hypothetical protein V3C99_001979 [Haemonchus contortus]